MLDADCDLPDPGYVPLRPTRTGQKTSDCDAGINRDTTTNADVMAPSDTPGPGDVPLGSHTNDCDNNTDRDMSPGDLPDLDYVPMRRHTDCDDTTDRDIMAPGAPMTALQQMEAEKEEILSVKAKARTKGQKARLKFL